MVVWNDIQVNTKDSKGSYISYQKCDGWDNNDVNSCNKNKPSGTIGWIPCAIGSDPKSGLCSPYSTDFNCKWGQNCYAIQKMDVVWDKPYTGCDGAGNKLTIQKCNNWPNNDPNFCYNSPSKPKTISGNFKWGQTPNTSAVKNWISCAIGSSPNGIASGDLATACSPISNGPNHFTCLWGQNCFAITSNEKSQECGNNFFSNPVGATQDFGKKVGDDLGKLADTITNKVQNASSSFLPSTTTLIVVAVIIFLILILIGIFRYSVSS